MKNFSGYDKTLSSLSVIIPVAKMERKKMARRETKRKENGRTEESYARPWVAKMLLAFNAVGRFVSDHGFVRDSIASVLGVEDLEDAIFEDRQRVVESVRRRCRRYLATAEAVYPENLVRNVDRLREVIALGDVEADILKFTVLLHYVQELDDVCDLLDTLNSSKVVRALAIILDLDEREVKKALSPRSLLSRSGLLEIDRAHSGSLKGKLDLPSGNFADMMVNYEGEDFYEIFKDVVRGVGGATLSAEDYDYMAKERDLLLRYLRRSVETRARGANILLYGRPGTGKTELVKMLAGSLGLELFEISYADEDDDPMSGRHRINAYKSAQYLFGDRPVLLMFDEIEDIFEETRPLSSLFGMAPVQNHKGWMNRILENSRVPAVWISNSASMMDPAVLRRFDRNKSSKHFVGSQSAERSRRP